MKGQAQSSACAPPSSTVRRQSAMAPVTGRQRNFDWYLNIALASINGLLLCIGLAFNLVALIRGDDFMRNPPASQSIQLLGVLAMVAVLSVFWFWFRMLDDYFRNRPETHAVAWGWALFMLSIGAALAYFWVIWRPRNRSTYSGDA